MNFDVIDEQYSGKVIGVFEQESTAKLVMTHLIEGGDFQPNELSLIRPGDHSMEEKVEPDSKGIGRSLFKSHMTLGLVGFAIGLIVALALIFFGPVIVSSSPIMVIFSLPVLFTFIGLMVAGVVSIRPDHDSVINSARHAKNHRQWSVVVQTKDSQQIEKAKTIMEKTALSISESY